jgi:hypothetical protein
MVTIRTLLNALNVYLALNYNYMPMTFKVFLTVLNSENRRPMRFYFVTLWAYFSTAATLVCILLPVLAPHVTTLVTQKTSDRVSLVLAILIELVWLFYALTVFSWRISGYLYKNAAGAMRWTSDRVRSAAVARLPKIFYREQS